MGRKSTWAKDSRARVSAHDRAKLAFCLITTATVSLRRERYRLMVLAGSGSPSGGWNRSRSTGRRCSSGPEARVMEVTRLDCQLTPDLQTE